MGISAKASKGHQVGVAKPDRTSRACHTVILAEDPAGRLLPGRAPWGRARRWCPEDASPAAPWLASRLRPVAAAILLRCRTSASVRGPSSSPARRMASRLFLAIAFWSAKLGTPVSPADCVPMGLATLRTGVRPASILDLSFPWRHLGSRHVPCRLEGGCVPSEVSVATS